MGFARAQAIVTAAAAAAIGALGFALLLGYFAAPARAAAPAGGAGLVAAGAGAADSAEAESAVLPAADVAKFVLDGDNRVIETGLTPGAGSREVQIAGLPGEATVSFSARTR